MTMEERTTRCLTREIDEIRENIRQKYNALKRLKEENDFYNTVKYKSIVNAIKDANVDPPFYQQKREAEEDLPRKPKRSLLQSMVKPREDVLNIFRSQLQHDLTLPSKDDQCADEESFGSSRQIENVGEENEQLHYSSAKFAQPDLFEHTPSKPLLEQASEEVKTPDGIKMAFDFLEKVGETPSKYVMKFLNNDLSGLDDTYGVRYDGKQFSIGDSIVTMGDNELEIGEDRYVATPGLMELIFMKKPDMTIVDDDDRKQYKNILSSTNAHRKRYSRSGEINIKRTHPKWALISSILKYEPRKTKTEPFMKAQTKRGFGAINFNHMIKRLKQLLSYQDENSKLEIEFIEANLRDARIIA